MTWLSRHCILAPLNKSAHAINTVLVEQLPGDCVEYRSLDSVPDESEAVQFPTEFFKFLRDLRIAFTFALIKGCCPINNFMVLSSPKVRY